jgi:hypothetical protein
MAHDVDITVYAEPGGNPATMATDIAQALDREIGRFGTTPSGSGASSVCRRVLIFVADTSGNIDPAVETAFSAGGCVIVPVVDGSVVPGVPHCLPAFMKTVLAETTMSFDPKPIVPRLLRAAGVVDSAVRIFISYRHDDAEAVASQLFHALAERGFAPFLDRFRSQPGDDFVGLIEEELADKACLVSLETANIGQSVYCRQEVATAVARRMGMIAVDLPHSVPTFPVIARRINMRRSGASGPLGQLGTADLGTVVREIEQHYPHEAARRPRWQDLTLRVALNANGRNFTADGLGLCVAHTRGGGQRLLAMSPGLPPARQFLELQARQAALGSSAATIMGPILAARIGRSEEIQWLGQRSNIDLEDEGRLASYVAGL